MSEPRYRWITEAYQILNPLLPCSINEALAALTTGLTQRAVYTAIPRSKNPSRFSAAKLAIAHLQKCRVVIRDGNIERKHEKERKSIGNSVMLVLKNTGKIKEGETGFTTLSAGTYRKILKKLGWIRIEADEWVWIGPKEATWSDVSGTRTKNAKHK